MTNAPETPTPLTARTVRLERSDAGFECYVEIDTKSGEAPPLILVGNWVWRLHETRPNGLLVYRADPDQSSEYPSWRCKETPMAHCKGCGAEILWFKTETGANIPLDSTPLKRFVLVGEPDRLYAKMMNTYMPHHATCPQVEQFRRPHDKPKPVHPDQQAPGTEAPDRRPDPEAGGGPGDGGESHGG